MLLNTYLTRIFEPNEKKIWILLLSNDEVLLAKNREPND